MLLGDVSPSPQPSPVKGEGELKEVNVYFQSINILDSQPSIQLKSLKGGSCKTLRNAVLSFRPAGEIFVFITLKDSSLRSE